MSKIKATRKEMKENYHRILGIGYCNAQFLLQYEQPIAYSTRAEGWACDYYEIDNVLISTGYAPLDSKNMKRDYNITHEYDNQAQAIVYNYDLSYEEKKEQVRELLKQFIAEVTL